MCYYNGQKVTYSESIQLKQLEKQVAEYEFLNRDLIEGFAYSHIATLNGIPGNEDFDIARMEWGFITRYMVWEATGYEGEGKRLAEGI